MSIENQLGRDNQEENVQEVEQEVLDGLDKSLDELKAEPQYERIPLRLREIIEDKNESGRGFYMNAADKIIGFEQMRDEANLSDSDVNLLGRAENPFELAKFTKDQRLRFNEISDRVAKVQQEKDLSWGSGTAPDRKQK